VTVITFGRDQIDGKWGPSLVTWVHAHRADLA
jgi:hypothetical protein